MDLTVDSILDRVACLNEARDFLYDVDEWAFLASEVLEFLSAKDLDSAYRTTNEMRDELLKHADAVDWGDGTKDRDEFYRLTGD